LQKEQKTMLDRSDSHGFTLIEILISLTIMSLIIVIISGAFRLGIKAWEKGEKDVDTRQRLRIVLDLVKHQLASACRQKVKIDGTSKTLFFGKAGSLGFVSRVPLIPEHKSGLSYVRYIIEDNNGTETLKVFETDFMSVKKESDLRPTHNTDYYTLINDIQKAEFEYLKKTEDGYEWKPSWNAEKNKGLPVAIRMTLKFKNSHCRIIRIMARIHDT